MDSLPSPDLIESVTKLLERVGVPSALVGALLYLLMRRGRGAGEMPEEWRRLTDQRVQALDTRLARLEAVQEDRWSLMRMYIAPSLKQPVHLSMDRLLDKLHEQGQLTVPELETLQAELEQRLREPEPSPGYHLRCLLLRDGVRYQLSLAPKDPDVDTRSDQPV